MKNYDVVIVGGGAGGLFCATALNQNLKVAIIEKEDRVGKKILATGNGRCNLTNLNVRNEFYNCNVEKYFEKFNNFDTLKYFEKLGLLTFADDAGRVYPISNTANSVLDVLRFNIQANKNIEIFLQTIISDIKKDKDYYKITLSNNQTISTKNIIIATGGNSNNFFNEKFIPYKKSLCSLKTTHQNKGLNGVRVDNVCATLNIGKQTIKEYGEILFKENAVSGIMIFNLSSYMARINNYEQTIVLDFLPNINEDDLVKILDERQNKILNNENILTGILHNALARNILEKCDFDTKNSKKIAKNIKNYEIFTKSPLDNNQVHSGGIDLDDLTNHLKSKKNNNIFYIGEVLNVDGLCGGYNLQWAWTSAKIVADYINNM